MITGSGEATKEARELIQDQIKQLKRLFRLFDADGGGAQALSLTSNAIMTLVLAHRLAQCW